MKKLMRDAAIVVKYLSLMAWYTFTGKHDSYYACKALLRIKMVHHYGCDICGAEFEPYKFALIMPKGVMVCKTH